MKGQSAISKEHFAEMLDENPFLSSTEIVYKLVLSDIVDHTILPGQKLNQEQIASTLDVSRTPVREALLQLERDGFLVKSAQGHTVYKMTIGDYMMLLDIRIAIESLAARLACSRIRVSEANNIEKNLKEMRALINAGSSKAWDDNYNIINKKIADDIFYQLGIKDQEFHVLIINASHNRYVVDTYEHLMPRIHFFRYSAMDVSVALNMMERHKMIYTAILSRDEDLAEAKMKTHLQLTLNRAMRY